MSIDVAMDNDDGKYSEEPEKLLFGMWIT